MLSPRLVYQEERGRLGERKREGEREGDRGREREGGREAEREREREEREIDYFLKSSRIVSFPRRLNRRRKM